MPSNSKVGSAYLDRAILAWSTGSGKKLGWVLSALILVFTRAPAKIKVLEVCLHSVGGRRRQHYNTQQCADSAYTSSTGLEAEPQMANRCVYYHL